MPSNIMQPTLTQLQEKAAQHGFTLLQAVTAKGKRKLYNLRADWTYSDGYRPATAYALTAKEAYIFLAGFAAAKYE